MRQEISQRTETVPSNAGALGAALILGAIASGIMASVCYTPDVFLVAAILIATDFPVQTLLLPGLFVLTFVLVLKLLSAVFNSINAFGVFAVISGAVAGGTLWMGFARLRHSIASDGIFAPYGAHANQDFAILAVAGAIAGFVYWLQLRLLTASVKAENDAENAVARRVRAGLLAKDQVAAWTGNNRAEPSRPTRSTRKREGAGKRESGGGGFGKWHA